MEDEEADARAINAQPWEPMLGCLTNIIRRRKFGKASQIRSDRKIGQMGRRIMVDEGKLHQLSDAKLMGTRPSYGRALVP